MEGKILGTGGGMGVALTAGLLGLCLAAVWFDLRERRLPNALTLLGLALGLALRAIGGPASVGAGLAGAGIAFGVALPFFLVGGLGGGDVKLLAAVGAFLGTGHILEALLATALVGGVMALGVMIARRATFQTLVNLHAILKSFGPRSFTRWKKGTESQAVLTLESPGALTVPYGVAIAAGALLGWFA